MIKWYYVSTSFNSRSNSVISPSCPMAAFLWLHWVIWWCHGFYFLYDLLVSNPWHSSFCAGLAYVCVLHSLCGTRFPSYTVFCSSRFVLVTIASVFLAWCLFCLHLSCSVGPHMWCSNEVSRIDFEIRFEIQPSLKLI